MSPHGLCSRRRALRSISDAGSPVVTLELSPIVTAPMAPPDEARPEAEANPTEAAPPGAAAEPAPPAPHDPLEPHPPQDIAAPSSESPPPVADQAPISPDSEPLARPPTFRLRRCKRIHLRPKTRRPFPNRRRPRPARAPLRLPAPFRRLRTVSPTPRPRRQKRPEAMSQLRRPHCDAGGRSLSRRSSATSISPWALKAARASCKSPSLSTKREP